MNIKKEMRGLGIGIILGAILIGMLQLDYLYPVEVKKVAGIMAILVIAMFPVLGWLSNITAKEEDKSLSMQKVFKLAVKDVLRNIQKHKNNPGMIIRALLVVGAMSALLVALWTHL